VDYLNVDTSVSSGTNTWVLAHTPHIEGRDGPRGPRIRLAGYEVYRLGGNELTDRRAAALVLAEFFDSLFDRYRIGQRGTAD